MQEFFPAELGEPPVPVGFEYTNALYFDTVIQEELCKEAPGSACTSLLLSSPLSYPIDKDNPEKDRAVVASSWQNRTGEKEFWFHRYHNVDHPEYDQTPNDQGIIVDPENIGGAAWTSGDDSLVIGNKATGLLWTIEALTEQEEEDDGDDVSTSNATIFQSPIEILPGGNTYSLRIVASPLECRVLRVDLKFLEPSDQGTTQSGIVWVDFGQKVFFYNAPGPIMPENGDTTLLFDSASFAETGIPVNPDGGTETWITYSQEGFVNLGPGGRVELEIRMVDSINSSVYTGKEGDAIHVDTVVIDYSQAGGDDVAYLNLSDEENPVVQLFYPLEDREFTTSFDNLPHAAYESDDALAPSVRPRGQEGRVPEDPTTERSLVQSIFTGEEDAPLFLAHPLARTAVVSGDNVLVSGTAAKGSSQNPFLATAGSFFHMPGTGLIPGNRAGVGSTGMGYVNIRNEGGIAVSFVPFYYNDALSTPPYMLSRNWRNWPGVSVIRSFPFRGETSGASTVGGTVNIVAHVGGLFDAEYPGWFTDEVGSISPEDNYFGARDSIMTSNTWQGRTYRFYAGNPFKHPRIVSFAAHAFPRCFSVQAPTIPWLPPHRQPYSQYENNPDLPVSEVHTQIWGRLITQSVEFTYGSPFARNRNVYDAISLSQVFNSAQNYAWSVPMLSGSDSVIFRVQATQKRVFRMQWGKSGFGSGEYVGKQIPMQKPHVYGQMLWADGNYSSSIAIVTYTTIDYTFNNTFVTPDESPTDYWDDVLGAEGQIFLTQYDPPTETINSITHMIAVIHNGSKIWELEVFHDEDLFEAASGAYMANDSNAIWFERIYDVPPQESDTKANLEPPEPIQRPVTEGWRMHIRGANNQTLETEPLGIDPGITPNVMGCSKDFFFVTGFALTDQLTSPAGGHTTVRAWMMSYDLTVMVPLHLVNDGYSSIDRTDSANWPLRSELSLPGSVAPNDPVFDIDALGISPNVEDFGKIGDPPEDSKYPSRIPETP